MQHVEFFHKEHFEHQYHRAGPPLSLEHFIDFFWETKFDSLWTQYPRGFSDALFPNIGYTYLINLGTPFIMQVEEKKFRMKGDGFLPRHKAIECYHQPGNKIFGIKFRISPVIFEKKVNFSEYREYIFPLSYLMDQAIANKIKKAASFEARVKIANIYFESIIKRYSGSLQAIKIVTKIVDHCNRNNDFSTPVADFANHYGISSRTLQRYFEAATSLSSKKALQILRIRKAVSHLTHSPEDFHFSKYGYYDHSHFYKHLRRFLQKNTLKKLQPHLRLLENLHKKCLQKKCTVTSTAPSESRVNAVTVYEYY
ncbi:MAG TPA: helix-turn-helix domain-containing protein [Chitinophagaceae bacterium]|nr:helix-turn-helix domain-containing protein [Chitinophagaceae bacterium]